MFKQIAVIAQVAVLGLGLANTAAHAQALKPTELKELTASAKTAADHEKIAKHYDAKAAEYEATAKEHDELAAEYTKHPSGHDQKHPNMGLTASHCKTIAESSRKAAAAAKEMAAAHRAMAKQDSK